MAAGVLLWEFALLFSGYYFVVLFMLLWPGAIILGPTFGLIAATLRPDVYNIRLFCNWNILSGISVITGAVIYYDKYIQIDAYIWVAFVYLVFSKVTQCIFANIFLSNVVYKRSLDKHRKY